MSSLIVISAVGVAASAYSANEQGKRADKANNQALAAYAANQGVASELKQRQQRLVDQPLEKRLAELNATGLTPEGQLAQDQLVNQTGLISRQIDQNAPLAGEGVTGARQLTNQFRQAQGLATLGLQDTVNKNREKTGLMEFAAQTPGWANVATGANTQVGGYEERLAGEAASAEQSDWAAAAQGMQNIGSAYAKYHAPKAPLSIDEQARNNRSGQGLTT
jgi:hypothetical protein